jgi:hypothetical protein
MKLISKIVQVVFLSGALVIMLVSHYAAACGTFSTNIFDGSLFLLQSIYAAKGLIPYREFGFLYPPGTALVLGKLFSLSQPESVTMATWVGSFLLLSVGLLLVVHLRRGRAPTVPVGLLCILGAYAALIWAALLGTEPFSHWLIFLIMLFTLRALQLGLGPGLVVSAAMASCALALVRWDRAVAVSGLTLILSITVWGYLWLQKYKCEINGEIRQQALIVTAMTGALFFGELVAGLLVISYALYTGALSQTIEFVIKLPLAILPFRQLPLPRVRSVIALTALGLMVFAGGVTIWSTRQSKNVLARTVELGVLLIGPLSVLPYVLGRSDAYHFFPLTVLTFGATSVGILLWPCCISRVGCTIALALLLLPLQQELKPYIRQSLHAPLCGRLQQKLVQSTADCINLIPSGTRSLFVGQASYDRYILNLPILYLARPDLRPATPFISDEPGIQNDCRYGAQIARSLVIAPKPMVAFLSTDPMGPEPNRTRTMRSCGSIERFLASSPNESLGTCRVDNFNVRAIFYFK